MKTLSMAHEHSGITTSPNCHLAKNDAKGSAALTRRNNSDTFQEMIDSILTPFPQCIDLLRANIKLDPHFASFYAWSRKAHVPVIVLSSGMTPIIRALLVHLIGPEANDIEIVCNDVVDVPPKTKELEGGWNIKFHDDSGFGHDKSLTIRPYAEYFKEHPEEERPTMFYAGDGVSDLSAARETDLLFAKKGRGESLTRLVPQGSLADAR